MREPTIVIHAPRRVWFRPWQRRCRCGLGTWPCHAVRLRATPAAVPPYRPDERPTWRRPSVHLSDVCPLLTRGQEARAPQPGG